MNQKINDTRFAKMSQRYKAEQGKNAKKIKALRLGLKKLEGRQMDIDTLLEAKRRYISATEITQRMVLERIAVWNFEQKICGVTFEDTQIL